MIEWQWSRFETLSVNQLYDIVAVREAVFIVEQKCPYLDVDGIDRHSWHLIAWKEKRVAAYLRVVDPGIKYAEPSIGRVLTTEDRRGSGLGKELLRRSLERIDRTFPRQGIRISAQEYLEGFYSSFGFARVSASYDEDGIPHIEMLRNKSG